MIFVVDGIGGDELIEENSCFFKSTGDKFHHNGKVNANKFGSLDCSCLNVFFHLFKHFSDFLEKTDANTNFMTVSESSGGNCINR